MIGLAIGMAVLAVLLIAFLGFGLRRAEGVAANQRRFEQEDQAGATNVRIFHARLAELGNQRDQDELTDGDYRTARLELERSLLSDGESHPRGALASAGSGRGLVVVLGIAAIAGAIGCYWGFGDSSDVELYGVRQSVTQSDDASPEHYIERYETFSRQKPGNANVWGLLYPLYRDSGRYDDAVGAIQHYIRLKGANNDPNLLAELAQARFFAADRQMTPRIQRLLDRVAALNPQQPTMHSLLGFNDFTHGDYAGAVSHWRIALAGQGDSGNDSMLRQALKVAQQRMNGTTK